jgi:tRNA-splicing ligase RtcB (3'-phosphate/5'-hydroxy nucleic acid ligase)
MVGKSELNRLAPYLWEVPKGWREDMRVPGRIYADEEILDMALADRSIEQLVNTTTLPGIVGYAMAMPDVHQGYGFPIGGVAATALPDGVISPGGVGYDINCGVRLLTSTIEAEAIRPHMQDVMDALYAAVPTGVGASRGAKLSDQELSRVLEQGSEWAVRSGQATARDLEHTEDHGRMEGADASAVSARARERGRDQIGTLGSGNHFLEVDEIVEVYDEEVAGAFGLVPGRVTVWIHCGSRGLGHQVCSDYVRLMQGATAKYHITLPDRELVCAPLDTPEGRQYLAAMACAANYAWANRQVITHLVRGAFERALAGKLPPANLEVLYDVCHNIAKIEEHTVDGRRVRLCVHRKGATRAFGPGRPEVPAAWRHLGQPVLIPGDMGSGSYVLVGTERAMAETFGSTCHGAGRTMSRGAAKRAVRGQQLRAELEAAHIVVRAGSMAGLAEEAPSAYKDLERVVRVVHEAGLARRVARTRPLGVMKG